MEIGLKRFAAPWCVFSLPPPQLKRGGEVEMDRSSGEGVQGSEGASRGAADVEAKLTSERALCRKRDMAGDSDETVNSEASMVY